METKRQKIIAQLQELGVEFNPNAQERTLQRILDRHSEGTEEAGHAEELRKKIIGDTEETTQEPDPKSTEHSVSGEILEAIRGISSTVQDLAKRIEKVENGDKNAHMDGATEEDVSSASTKNKDIDPRIREIVEETLGTDFAIEINGNKDKPGFLFTVIVPQRLSDMPMDSRPIIKEGGGYKKDDNGNVLFEDFYPEDRRSRAIGALDSYDVIRKHCDTVRSYIVAYYQKLQQPLPEFKVK